MKDYKVFIDPQDKRMLSTLNNVAFCSENVVLVSDYGQRKQAVWDLESGAVSFYQSSESKPVTDVDCHRGKFGLSIAELYSNQLVKYRTLEKDGLDQKEQEVDIAECIDSKLNSVELSTVDDGLVLIVKGLNSRKEKKELRKYIDDDRMEDSCLLIGEEIDGDFEVPFPEWSCNEHSCDIHEVALNIPGDELRTLLVYGKRNSGNGQNHHYRHENMFYLGSDNSHFMMISDSGDVLIFNGKEELLDSIIPSTSTTSEPITEKTTVIVESSSVSHLHDKDHTSDFTESDARSGDKERGQVFEELIEVKVQEQKAYSKANRLETTLSYSLMALSALLGSNRLGR